MFSSRPSTRYANAALCDFSSVRLPDLTSRELRAACSVRPDDVVFGHQSRDLGSAPRSISSTNLIAIGDSLGCPRAALRIGRRSTGCTGRRILDSFWNGLSFIEGSSLPEVPTMPRKRSIDKTGIYRRHQQNRILFAQIYGIDLGSVLWMIETASDGRYPS